MNNDRKRFKPNLELSQPSLEKVPSSLAKLGTFPERLYSILGGGSARAFALRANLTVAAFHKYLKGQSEPTRLVMIAIANTAGVSLEWLATGNGPMRKEDLLPVPVDQSFKITNLDGRQVDFTPSKALCHCPVLTMEAACGNGAFISQEAVKAVFSATRDWFRRELHANPANLCLIQARGDSMENTIMSEEMVFVDRSWADDPCDSIWVYRYDTDLFLKRLQFIPRQKIVVKSDNPLYHPYEIERNGSLTLLGRVIAALPLRRL